MLVPNQKVEVRWNPRNKKYYERIGYVFTKMGDKIDVPIEKLPNNSSAFADVICDSCGKEYRIRYCDYIKKIKKHNENLCQKCSAKRLANKTLKERQEKMYSVVLDFCKFHNYTLLTKKEELINNQSEVRYICPIHGECKTKYTSIQQGKQCYKCSRKLALKKKAETTLTERQNKLYQKALEVSKQQGYELISKKEEIINNHTYIIYRCPCHGLKKMRISNYNSYKGCPDCATENLNALFRLDSDEVEKRIENLGGKLRNKEEYVNTTEENLIIDCPYCGHPFTTSLRLFCQHGGQACPNCRNTESIGEKKIRMYLENRNIAFDQEKWFSDCRDINPLPFDFYLPNSNQIIEFDGRQHFDQSSLFYHTPFSEQKSHDEIKNKYCEHNNIKLLRIPYWEINNIDNILNDFICT